jgi:hypothetical protein
MDILDPLAAPPSAPGPASFFHADSDSVRFWVKVEHGWMGATVSRRTLHHRFRPGARDDDPLETHRSHLDELEAAVRKRVAGGSIEPVMIREFDLRTDAKPPPVRPS